MVWFLVGVPIGLYLLVGTIMSINEYDNIKREDDDPLVRISAFVLFALFAPGIFVAYRLNETKQLDRKQ